MAITRPILASIVRNALGVDPGLELFETHDPVTVPLLARSLEAQPTLAGTYTIDRELAAAGRASAS